MNALPWQLCLALFGGTVRMGWHFISPFSQRNPGCVSGREVIKKTPSKPRIKTRHVPITITKLVGTFWDGPVSARSDQIPTTRPSLVWGFFLQPSIKTRMLSTVHTKLDSLLSFHKKAHPSTLLTSGAPTTFTISFRDARFLACC